MELIQPTREKSDSSLAKYLTMFFNNPKTATLLKEMSDNNIIQQCNTDGNNKKNTSKHHSVYATCITTLVFCDSTQNPSRLMEAVRRVPGAGFCPG